MSRLPETDVARIARWCRARVPAQVRDQVRVEADVAERHVTIVECRPPWDGQGDWTRFPIARLRYTASKGVWSLLWRDRNLRFHAYDRVPATVTWRNCSRSRERSDRDLLGLIASARPLVRGLRYAVADPKPGSESPGPP